MLKISVIDGARRCRLVVEGKLIAPWAAVLRSACEKARADLGGRELIIELKHVTAINHEGEDVILELINGGIKLRGDGVFTKRVVKDLTRHARICGFEQVFERDQFQVQGEEVTDKEKPQ